METYFEPPTPNPTITFRIANFLHIRHDRPLMTRIDNIIRPTRERMAPLQFHRAARLERNDRVGLGRGVGAAIAYDVVGGDIVDGAVVAGDTDAVAYGAGVDGDEDCVGGGEGEEGEESGGFHDCG